MSRLLEHRKRLSVIQNIDKIVKAMQTVTIGKVRKSQENLKICRNYGESLAGIICQNFDELEPYNRVFDFSAGRGPVPRSAPSAPLKNRPLQKTLLVLFTASRSFSGDFTEKVFLKAREFVRTNSLENVLYFAVGKKGETLIKNKGLPTVSAPMVSEIPNYPEAQKLAEDIRRRFSAGEFNEIYFIYNRFRSILFQEPQVVKIFPAPEELKKTAKGKNWFLWEPTVESAARNIFEQYLDVKTYQIYFETFASELAARMINLKSASESSHDLIKSLSIQINKARQARITEELTEIISSYEVIREESEV